MCFTGITRTYWWHSVRTSCIQSITPCHSLHGFIPFLQQKQGSNRFLALVFCITPSFPVLLPKNSSDLNLHKYSSLSPRLSKPDVLYLYDHQDSKCKEFTGIILFLPCQEPKSYVSYCPLSVNSHLKYYFFCPVL